MEEQERQLHEGEIEETQEGCCLTLDTDVMLITSNITQSFSTSSYKTPTKKKKKPSKTVTVSKKKFMKYLPPNPNTINKLV